ncbi:hypothetical protein Tco_0090758 [Tanacetum coccineum]
MTFSYINAIEDDCYYCWRIQVPEPFQGTVASSLGAYQGTEEPLAASNQCMDNMLLLYDLLLHVECDIGVIVYSCRQDLGFIPSGNVVLSSTYVGKILGADQLLVILCYRYQESGIGYWILSMTISGSGKFSVSTPLCYDDIHDVTPRVSALAGCDRLVSEPLVIEN